MATDSFFILLNLFVTNNNLCIRARARAHTHTHTQNLSVKAEILSFSQCILRRITSQLCVSGEVFFAENNLSL